MRNVMALLVFITAGFANDVSATTVHAGAELTVAGRGEPLLAGVVGWSRPEPRAGHGWRSGGELTVTLLEASSPETGHYRRDGFRYWWGAHNDHGMRIRTGTVIGHESSGNYSQIVTELFLGFSVEVQRTWRLEAIFDTGQHYSLAASWAF